MGERQGWRFDVGSSLLTLAVVGLGALGYHLWQAAAAPSHPTTTPRDLAAIARLKTGEQGTLRDPMRQGVMVTREREDYEAMAAAQTDHDQMTIQEMVRSGRGFRLANGNAAEIRGKDPTGVVKIRVLGGDQAGETGWTSGDFFRSRGTFGTDPAPLAPAPPAGGP